MARQGTLNPSDPGYWEWRAKTGLRGKPKAFKNPKHLWQLACEYFKRTDNHPFLKQEQRKGSIRVDKDSILSPEEMKDLKNPVIELKQMRPYTWAGFTSYLFEQGMISTLQDYKQNRDNRYDDYVEVIAQINEVMYSQKFEGAASGVFNANIIARDLGLAEKTISDIKVEEKEFDYSKLSNEALEEIAKQANADKPE